MWGQVKALYLMRLVAVQNGACHCPEAVLCEVAGLVFHTPESHDQGCGSDIFATTTAGRGEHKLAVAAELIKSLHQLHSLMGQGTTWSNPGFMRSALMYHSALSKLILSHLPFKT